MTQLQSNNNVVTQSLQDPALTGDLQPEIEARNFNFYYNYGHFKALNNINLTVPRHKISAFIGSSGCGKSTFLRAVNRMHDRTPGASSEGQLLFEGQDINAITDITNLRKRIGMIFQQPAPFPLSIFDNVAYGMRLEAQRVPKSEITDRVEHALRAAALWKEVHDKLDQSGLALSGGQQQRLCIARAIAVEPAVLLMDEPCAALDPIATLKIEDLIRELSQNYTILIVTHNMEQASRVSDFTAFFTIDENRAGTLAEYGPTKQIFTKPRDRRTEDYITGRFG